MTPDESIRTGDTAMRALLAIALVAGTAAAGCCGDVPVLTCSAPTDIQVMLFTGTDRVLVRETCGIYLPAGQSEVRLRWGDPDIDEASVALAAPDGVTVGGVRQLPDEPKTFIWPVQVEQAGARAFVASYYLRGLRWSPTYVLTLDSAAGKASLRGMLHFTNDSRMPLRGVHLQLRTAPVGMLEKGIVEGTAPPVVYADIPDFSLEPGWQKRITFASLNDAPAHFVYRADNEVWHADVQRLLRVDLRGVPIPAALPVGHLEVREVIAGRRAAVLGTDLNHVTWGETEINLGVERGIIYERTLCSTGKLNVEFDRMGRVSGFDTTEEVRESLRNRLTTPAHIEIVERVPGAWELATETAPAWKGGNDMRFDMDLQPADKAEVAYTVTRHTGTRVK
jgi:hypothetical protein